MSVSDGSSQDKYDIALIRQICRDPWKDPESLDRIVKVLEPMAEYDSEETARKCRTIAQEVLACAFDAGEIDYCPLCGATDDEDADNKCFGEPCPVSHTELEGHADEEIHTSTD